MEQPETPKYATLFYDVRHKLDISWTEYLLLDMVYHLSARKGYCYKSPSNMASDLNITKRGVNKMVIRLQTSGLLERLTDYTLRVTNKYLAAQTLSTGGNSVPTKRAKGGNSVPGGGNSVTLSGNSETDLQGLRITKNNNRIDVQKIEKELAAKEKQAKLSRPGVRTKSLSDMYQEHLREKRKAML